MQRGGWSPEPRGARTEGGAQGQGTPGVGVGGGRLGGGRGQPEREAGGAARRVLTAAERGLAVPDVRAGGLPAGLPEGQVVLVVGGDPGGAQHGPQVQTQRQEDAHQPDQLQRGQHRHAHLLHAAARRSHARSPTAPGAQQPRRRAPEREDSLPPGSARLPPRRAAESARAAGRAGVVGSRSDAHPPCQRPLRLAPSQAAGRSAQRGGAVSGTGGLPAE